MNKFFKVSALAACSAALVLTAGCGDGGNGQQAASSDAGSAAPAAQKVSLKVASAFPLSLPLLGESAVTYAEKIERVE